MKRLLLIPIIAGTLALAACEEEQTWAERYEWRIDENSEDIGEALSAASDSVDDDYPTETLPDSGACLHLRDVVAQVQKSDAALDDSVPSFYIEVLDTLYLAATHCVARNPYLFERELQDGIDLMENATPEQRASVNADYEADEAESPLSPSHLDEDDAPIGDEDDAS